MVIEGLLKHEDKLWVRVAVACCDANGSPAMHFCVIACTEDEFRAGKHYDVARDVAEDAGYEDVAWMCDEVDAAKAVMQCYNWYKCPVWSVTGKVIGEYPERDDNNGKNNKTD